jgi:hypothetical protein
MNGRSSASERASPRHSASPRERGSTPGNRRLGYEYPGFPARAGIDPKAQLGVEHGIDPRKSAPRSRRPRVVAQLRGQKRRTPNGLNLVSVLSGMKPR